ncbi:MAG: ribose 5-phosphate isomerase A [Candidatus Micrarchaeia archaeon]
MESIAEIEKEDAARRALQLVKSGMTIGLGSGTTSEIFIKMLGQRAHEERLKVRCIATSVRSEKVAKSVGLNVVEPREIGAIDIAFDGADYVGNGFLIKGLGGALTREKIIAYWARKFVVMVDSSKLKYRNILPVEVLPFAASFLLRRLGEYGEPHVRTYKNKAALTDNKNIIVDVCLRRKPTSSSAKILEKELNSIPGVVENGIFTRKAQIIVGSAKPKHI